MLKTISSSLKRLTCGASAGSPSIPRAIKLATVASVVSLVGIGGGAICLGFGFFPPLAAIGTLFIGTIGLVACLVFVIFKREKSTGEPSPIAPTDSGEVPASQEIWLHTVNDPNDSEKLILTATIGLGHQIRADCSDGGAEFLKKIEKEFPGISPKFRLFLADSEAPAFLACPQFFSSVTSLCISFSPYSKCGAQLAQLISSFTALQEIDVNVVGMWIDSAVIEDVLRAIGEHQTLQKVSFGNATGITLEKMGSNVDSLTFHQCTQVDAKSVLEGRKWKQIRWDCWAADKLWASNDAVPERITTEKLEISFRAISVDPLLLGRFAGVRTLTLLAPMDTDMHGTLEPLLKYEQLTEITLKGRCQGQLPDELLKTVGRIPHLKKLTILKERFRNEKSAETLATDAIREMLLAANPNLEIVEEDSICDYGVRGS
ncbi:MAG: hypothetical protein LBB26_03700 [Puniceicoccales bacterium]|jgi:hypothetical protein|nr:hypothetical protein [Puniceicoccales bacterium]